LSGDYAALTESIVEEFEIRLLEECLCGTFWVGTTLNGISMSIRVCDDYIE